MTATPFRPVLYLMRSCPFCLKVAALLSEVGAFDTVDLRAFWPGDEHEAPIRAALAPHLEKITFPALEVEPGRFIADSDAIVALYAQKAGVDPANLPFYQYVMAGPFRRIREAHVETLELKKRLGEA
ncbi:glutathione S-transferase N-terminal domain-containing protein [Novosphingobium sp. SG720]|uniref:glutathione S-transferase N-terminal domain-containing protein n=1 Tax=Novosphingobium sp. SG720 TaxID=2586998 RepID=UPI001445669C|nr:glutathione S-transferase N-terminal domain-containing protein [Novosphingobium sp. SG720]NKJ41150.1 glutathione S-transferase [Novosphingobium sp. SG720]